MKKALIGLLLIGLLVTLANLGIGSSYQRYDGDNTTRSFTVTVATADTAADGTLPLCDTAFSDTISCRIDPTNPDSLYRFLNIMAYVDFDTGAYLGDDSVLDLIYIETHTGYHDKLTSGTFWRVQADTMGDLPDSVQIKIVMDTLVYNNIFFKMVYVDTLNPDDNDDVNTYTVYYDVLMSGQRD